MEDIRDEIKGEEIKQETPQKKFEVKKWSKGKEIAFWIIFPILTLLISLLLVFYLDLANGPLICFIVELVAIAAVIVFRILLRKKIFYIRMLPFLGLVLVNAIIIPLAKPSIESFRVVSHKNPEKTEVMHLANGDVVGLYNSDKTVRVYGGIPYAKAPIGDLRWKEPQDVENWTGVKDCTYYGPMSMQKYGSPLMDSISQIYASKGWYPDWNMEPLQNRSEDSLYLNIWRPNNNETNLPILVYIHGGSLTGGSSMGRDINGEEMAKTGVIMITIQYRLGVFGYFAHSQLVEESPNHTTGNYGLLDQIKALQWVNDNATYFGGDKSNITIAGESAGSSSVSALCSSPLAAGLFKRAIGESSSLVTKKVPHTFRTMEAAQKMGQNIMKEFNCLTIEEMRKIPAEKLVETGYENSQMTIDQYALPKAPYEVYRDGENNEEALLNGYNIREADPFIIAQNLFNPVTVGNIKGRLTQVFGEDIGTKIYNLYLDKINVNADKAYNEIISVLWFIAPHHSWSNMALNSPKTSSVYRYQFTKFNKYRETFHAGEMIYAYGNVKHAKYSHWFNQSDLDLSKIMLSYWSNFAKTGNPNGEGLPTWNKYMSSTDNVMELGSNVGPIEDRYLELYKLIEEFNNL